MRSFAREEEDLGISAKTVVPAVQHMTNDRNGTVKMTAHKTNRKVNSKASVKKRNVRWLSRALWRSNDILILKETCSRQL